MSEIIARLLLYTFDPIGWDYEKLTDAEKAIMGDQNNMDWTRELCKQEIIQCCSEEEYLKLFPSKRQ